jgi:hypothetical protein
MNPGGFAAALAEVVPSLAPGFAVRTPPLAEILRRWSAVEPMLRRATARTQGCYEPEDVLAQICTGRCTMLFIERGSELVAVAVTEVRDFPRKRVLDVGFIGAKPGADTGVREWAPILTAALNDMARAVGATMLSGCGRIGWARVAGFRIAGGYVTRIVP